MHLPTALRRAIPIGLMGVTLVATPAFAFQPTVTALVANEGDSLTGTDLATRGGDVAVSTDRIVAGERVVDLASSTNAGATWAHELVYGSGGAARESQATMCAGRAFMVYAVPDGLPPSEWLLWTYSRDLSSPIVGGQRWTSSGVARKPDIACVKNVNLVVARFQQQGGGYDLKVQVKSTVADDPWSQSFDLGSASMGRGLSVASTASRVYVAWFHGDDLRVRRFSIGSSGHHALTSLDTRTIATLAHGTDPRIGADGDRVVIAYMDKADLKVRRSGDKGVSFGSAKTLLNEPYPSEVAARPTTVAVQGSRVAIGALETSESTGTGIGFLSTNGGSSYSQQVGHGGGRVLAGLVTVSGNIKYAEAWDQSIAAPSKPKLFFHRQ
jgi:hypothetical protein